MKKKALPDKDCLHCLGTGIEPGVPEDESGTPLCMECEGAAKALKKRRVIESAAQDLLAAAKALQEWAAMMGGWEAKPWRDLAAAIEKAEKK